MEGVILEGDFDDILVLLEDGASEAVETLCAYRDVMMNSNQLLYSKRRRSNRCIRGSENWRSEEKGY